MSSVASWVIGRGLLGRAVIRSLGEGAYVHAPPVDWADPSGALADLRRALVRLTESDADRLQIFWCAGKAVTSSTQEQLDAEFDTFAGFLNILAELEPGDRRRLSVFLASSVGGAYAGSPEPPFTESTPPHPASGYGRTKLRMEQALAAATSAGGWRAFVARITNLYGPGQDLRKGQGLLSVIVASYLTRRPVSVYVPLDTLRDYIYEDDCADIIVAGTDRVSTLAPGTTVMKIVGAMAPQSIGAILGENRRLRRQPPPVVLGQGNATGQSSDLRVRSEVWTDLDALVRTTLPQGLDALFRAQLATLARGTAETTSSTTTSEVVGDGPEHQRPQGQ